MVELVEKERTIRLRLVTNPFDPTTAVNEELIYSPDFTLADYMQGLPSPDAWVIGYNGVAFEQKLWTSVRPQAGAVISLVRSPEGGGGSKNILRLVAMIAIAVAAPYLAPYITPLAFAGSTTFAVIATAAIAVTGALVVNALLPPPTPDFGDAASLSSTSYGVDGPKNTNQQGGSVPVGYGEFRVGGNFCDLYTENIGDLQYIFGRLVLNDGEIEEVSGIEINDQPIANYQAVNVRVAFGLETETANDWFPQAVKLTNRGIKLDVTPVVHTTEGPVDKVRLDLVAPNGVVAFDNKGKPQNHSVGVLVEYRPFGSGTWSPLPMRKLVSFTGTTTTGVTPPNTTYIGVGVTGNGLPVPGTDLRFTTGDVVEYRPVGSGTWLPLGSSERQFNGTGAMNFVPATNDSDTVNNTFETFYEASVPPGEYEVRSSGNGWFTDLVAGLVYDSVSAGSNHVISGNSTKAIRQTLESAVLPRDRYDVRVRRTVAPSTDPQISDAVFLTDVGEIDVSPVRLNGTATLSVRLKISDQINSVPKITALVKLSKLREFDQDGNVTITRWSANPAWIVLDILTNPVRGANVPLTRIDWPRFVEWAEFCAAEGLQFNGVFDTETNIWEACQTVMRCGHAQFVRMGTKWSVAIDRAADPVMLFNDSNIIEGTMSATWLPMTDRANEVQISYAEAEDGFRESTVRLVDNNIAISTEATRAARYQQKGITNRAQATAEAEYQLRRNKLLRKSVEFEAPIEAIALNIGDVALIQYKSGDYAGGENGRCATGSTLTNVMLDRPVVIEAGNTYSLLVHQAAVKRYDVNIVSIAGKNVFVSGLPAGSIGRCTRLRRGGVDVEIINITDSSPQDIVRVVSTTGLTTGAAELWDTNVVEERTITTGVGTHQQVTVSSAFSVAPALHATWMFGRVTTLKKPFRLIGMGGDSAETRSLAFIEYNANLYLPPGMDIPDVEGTPPDLPQQVRDISVEYRRFPTGDQDTTGVIVSWTVPNRLRYGGADVYMRSSASGWVLIKSVTDVTAADVMLSDTDTGLFKVVGYDKQGRRANFIEAPVFLFNADLSYRTLTPPTNFTVDDRRYNVVQRLDVSWDAPADEIVTLYRVDYRRMTQIEYDEIIANPSLIQPGPLATPVEIAAWNALFRPAFVTTDTAGTIDNLSEGYYSFRVRAERGQSYSDWTVITHILDVPNFIDAVTGLALDKGGTTFTGKDAVFVWDDIFVNAAAATSGDPDGIPFILRNYEVQIRDLEGNLVRTDFTETPGYTYTFEKNVADSTAIADTARRSFQITVRAVGRHGQISAPASLTVSNPPPALPAVEIVELFGQVLLKFTEPSDPDFAGIVVYRTAVDGVPVTSPPVFTSSGAGTAPENVTGPVYTATASGSGPITFSISGGADAARFTINGTTGVLSFVTPPNFESPADAGGDNVYNVTISATNSFGTANQPTIITVTNVAEGAAPVFTSGASASFAENGTGTAYTAAASGAGPISYSISGGTDSALFAINSTTGAVTFVSAPNYESPADAGGNNVYNITVTATNSFGSVNQAVAITVTDVAEGTSPSFTSGTSASFAENATGTAYTAVATGSPTISYSITGGADASLFSINSSTGAVTFNTSPNFESPADAGANNVYNITVTATNSFGSANLNVAITVTDVAEGSAPTFTSGTTASFAENGTGTAYTAVATGSGPITYSIVGGADATDFSINTSTGAVTFVATPNFEAPVDADTNNAYIVTIRATNSFGSTDRTVTITVTDVAEGTAPTFTSGTSASFAENGTGTAYTAIATGSGPITYSLVAGGDASLFSINSSTGAVTFNTSPNFEAPADAGANNVYNITVRATNSFGSTDRSVAITVTDVADNAPAFTSGTSASFAENGTGTAYTAVATGSGTITYSISGGADAARFSINSSTGAVTFNTPPDFEAPTDAGTNNVYDIVVTATNAFGSANRNVAITVTNVADVAPTFTSGTSASFAENATGTVYTAVATGTGTITYSISGGADAARFSINGSTGVVTFNTPPNFESPTDAGANNVYDIVITATNAFGSANRNVAVTVTNVADDAPTFTSGTTVSFAENGTGTVYTAAATGSGSISYSISGGADAARFSINSSTGALTFNTPPDFETPTDSGSNNVYNITITATNAFGSANLNLAVTVTDVTEGGTTRTSPVFRSAATAASTTVSRPAGVVAGDLLIGMFQDFGTERAITLPAGWTAIGAGLNTGGDISTQIGYKIAGASEPTSYTFSISAVDFPSIVVLAFSNVDTSDPIAANARSTGSSSNATVPSVTVPNDNSALAAFISGYSETAGTVSGMTARGTNFATHGFSQVSVAAGATGARSNGVSNAIWVAAAIAINGAIS